MNKKFKFSQPSLLALKPGLSRQEYRDTAVTGLTLRVGTSGLKAFFALKRTKKKIGGHLTKRMKLGNFPTLLLDDARTACLEQLRIWENPETAPCPKLDKFFEKIYLEKHAKPRKKTWKDDEANYRIHIQPVFGNYLLDQISRPDVRAFHNEIGSRKRNEKPQTRTANKILSLLGKILNFAREEEVIKENPCSLIKKFPEKSRNNTLTSSQFKELKNKVLKLDDPHLQGFFLMAMETAARRGNLLSMQWDHISFEVMTWSVPGEITKNGSQLVLPLGKQSMGILKGLKKLIPNKIKTCVDSNIFVFPSEHGTHLHFPKRRWKTIVDSLPFEMTFHDIRRSRLTLLAGSGINTSILAEFSGHKDINTLLKHYQHIKTDRLRSALGKAGEDY